jgi:hypothetical protein
MIRILFVIIIICTLNLSGGENFLICQLDDRTILSEDPDTIKPQKEETVPDIKELPVVFVNADILNMRAYPTANSKRVNLVYRGDALNVKEKTKDSRNMEWLKVAVRKDDKVYTGWVAAEFTRDSRVELLNPLYKDLDYSPQEKIEYKSNPKVKARGIYMTRYSSTPTRVNHFLNVVKGTNINTFVIDIKNERGQLLFRSEAAEKYIPAANRSVMYRDVSELKKVFEKLKKNNIYVIGRVTAFKDDTYARFNPGAAIFDNETQETYLDRDKLRWVSPHDRGYWEYLVELSKEAADIGFNEIQYDYVRFTDWKSNLNFRNTQRESKAKAIQEFLKYAYSHLREKEVYVSADIFGLVGSASDDLNLGQYWEAISNVVDYISPMIYPSHFANGFGTIPVPDREPYKTIFIAARDAAARNRNIKTPAIIRPWIQGFTAIWLKNHLNYERKEILDQIRAMEAHGIDEYLIWNPKNRYPFLK